MDTVLDQNLPGREATRRSWRNYLAGLGPGLVVAIGSLGPRDIVTNSVAGSTAGYGLLWVLVVSFFIRATMLDASARYTLVSGESVLAGCGRLNPWVMRLWFTATLFRLHAGQILTVTLLGTAGNMVLPLPSPHSAVIWSVISWGAAFVLVCWGKYNLVEFLSKPLIFATGLCVAVTAILSKPDVTLLLSGLLHPVLPTGQQSYHPWVVVMGVLAATMGTSSSIRYSAVVHEKGWRTPSFLRQQRIDLVLSLLGMFVVIALMQIAAAGALQPRGIVVKRMEDIAPIFSSILGSGGVLLFGLTLWCITFSSSIGAASAYGIMLSDVFHRFIKPSSELVDGDAAAGSLPAYKWMIVYLFLTPLYVVLTEWSAVTLVFVVLVVSLLTVPIVLLMILRLTADRKIMGEYVNGWYSNAMLVFAVVCALYLAGRSLIDQFRG